jgi:hypothetical protein
MPCKISVLVVDIPYHNEDRLLLRPQMFFPRFVLLPPTFSHSLDKTLLVVELRFDNAGIDWESFFSLSAKIAIY